MNATRRDRDNKGMYLAGSLKSPSFVKSSTPSDYIIKESEHNVDGKLLSHLSQPSENPLVSGWYCMVLVDTICS
jgi:hypothetical protein